MWLGMPIIVVLVASADGPLHVAAPGLQTVNLAEGLGAFFTEHLAQALARQGMKVVTQREIAALLGVERQKQLLGCSEASSSCMTELANALGVEAVLIGDVARLSGRFIINLKIVSARDADLLASYSGEAGSDAEVADALTTAAATLFADATAKLGRKAPPPKPRVTPRAWVPWVVGAAIAGVGGALLVRSNTLYGTLTTKDPLSLSEAASLRVDGSLSQTLGWVALGVAVAAIVTGLVLFLVGSGV